MKKHRYSQRFYFLILQHKKLIANKKQFLKRETAFAIGGLNQSKSTNQTFFLFFFKTLEF